jgi:signal transduction histidine kinase
MAYSISCSLTKVSKIRILIVLFLFSHLYGSALFGMGNNFKQLSNNTLLTTATHIIGNLSGGYISYENRSNYTNKISSILLPPNSVHSKLAIVNQVTTLQIIQSFWFKIFLVLFILAILFILFKVYTSVIKRRNQLLEEQIEIRTRELMKMNENLLDEIKMRKEAEIRLIGQTEELIEINLSKDKFFSIISHDLKSPFQGLLGFTEMLNEDYDSMDNEQRKNIIKEIRSSSTHIYNLLINVLEWSRLQTKRVDFNPEKINLRNKIDEIKNLLFMNAINKEIIIHNEVNSDCFVFADENMLRSILHNLLSNALKFTRQGGYVKFRASLAGNFYVVNVIDNGIGISQDDIGKIFSIGIQYSTKGTSNEVGTGLGLTLCKEMIEKHGGSIWVESNLGVGSSFRFTLPRFRPQSYESSRPLDLFPTQN